jgi:hypothetical protein
VANLLLLHSVDPHPPTPVHSLPSNPERTESGISSAEAQGIFIRKTSIGCVGVTPMARPIGPAAGILEEQISRSKKDMRPQVGRGEEDIDQEPRVPVEWAERLVELTILELFPDP